MRTDGADVTLGGSAFHARAPATGNARSASEDRRPACGRNHNVGTGGRTQSLARINLGTTTKLYDSRELTRRLLI